MRSIKNHSNHLNTGHLNTRFIQIPDSIGVWYSNSLVMWLGWPFEYWKFWTINRLFSVQFSDHHLYTGQFDNWTQIYHLNTALVLVWYSDGCCTVISQIPDTQNPSIWTFGHCASGIWMVGPFELFEYQTLSSDLQLICAILFWISTNFKKPKNWTKTIQLFKD